MIEIKHSLTGKVLFTVNANTLRGADLYRADLYGANLSSVKGVIAAGTPDGWTAYGWLFEGYLMICVGCREKRLGEARRYWKDKADQREVLAAVEYIAAVAKIQGWKLTKLRK